MKNFEIGIATSFFAHDKFNSKNTLSYAKEQNINWVQLFLSDYYEENPEKIIELQKIAEKNKAKIIYHSPYLLNLASQDEKHAKNLCLFFPENQKKYAVFHFDENETIENALKTISFYNSFDIIVCLENFYKLKTKDGFIKNQNTYTQVIHRAIEKNLKIIPVIDFPRLFIKPLYETIDALFMTEVLLHDLSLATNEIFLHLIDFAKHTQERDEWLPVIEGIMPYKDIFSYLEKYNFQVLSAILEFENLEIGTKSIKTLSDFFNKI